MRFLKSILAAVLTVGLLSVPAAAIPLWSTSIGDVNFPGLTPNANIVTGVTAQKVASGEATFTGTTTVATGLTTIAACDVTIKIGTAPGVGTSTVTYTSSAGTLSLFGWKPTATGDATLIAATAAATAGWRCTGT